ncbi:MAG: polysaccharide export protein [Gammaproteobacteria bacterium]|nr:polysaccharide export protein [Gammaproteobacteria bacterium]
MSGVFLNNSVLYRSARVGWLVALLLYINADAWADQLSEYRIAPGDSISVRVFNEEDLSIPEVRVPADGIISYALIGEVTVTGLTVTELERRIAIMLQDGYLVDPKVTVSIVTYRPLFVQGAVGLPGVKEYSEGMSVEKVIVLAGGFAESANISAITVKRGSEEIPITDIKQRIFPGDIITVPARVEQLVEPIPAQFIYFHGEVRRPGSYEFRDGLTVAKAIALAGGFTDRASKRKIRIIRDGDPPEVLKRVTLNASIEPGDVIDVGTSLF